MPAARSSETELRTRLVRLSADLAQAHASADRLERANAALLARNRTLEQLVVDHTRELETANAALARRVDEEAAALVATQAQLLQSQKLEAVGQLTGGIAHDFNNLLTVITSGLQLLARASSQDHRARLIKRIEEAAWRGADLTRRLLAFARRQPLLPQPLDVDAHVGGLCELLRHGLRADILLRTAFAEGLWPAQADVAALELALLNLAVNARDAMPHGGTLVFGARNLHHPGGDPALANLAAGDYVEITVTDTGTGMTPEVLARVFEPFFTTKEAGKGTGLGLAQVYGFARQSGGTARVRSCLAGDQPSGTTVSILLPRASEAAAPVPPLVSPPPARTLQPRDHLSILVVEDDDEVAAIVLDMLDQLGHRGLRVSSVAAAVAVLSGAEVVDLIFTDVLLQGGGSGLDLSREVLRRQLPVPLVLTSGYGAGMTGRLAASGLRLLRKPYTLEALKLTLRDAIEPQPADPIDS